MLDVKKDRCLQILFSIEAIHLYMVPIAVADDFLKPETGQLHLDAIILRLQVIGENAKQIEDTYPLFFWQTLRYDIGYLVRFRDFISHHYEKLDFEIVYGIVVNKLPKLEAAIKNFLQQQ